MAAGGSLPGAAVDAVLAAPSGYAVFDADGTLWRDDVGEAFLRHLVALGWVQLSDGRDPYRAYEEAVERDKRTGYAYAAQLLAGLPAARVQAEASRFAAAWVPPRIIASTESLLMVCRSSGHAPVVVSASQIDIVRAAVVHAGVPWTCCAGMTTEVGSDGRYAATLLEPLTYAEGKVAAAVDKKWGPIAIAVGDSFTSDLALLAAASVPIVVAAQGASPLSEEAARRGWIVIS